MKIEDSSGLMQQRNQSFIESGSVVLRRGFLFSAVSIFLAGRMLRGDQETTLSVDVKVVNLLATLRSKQGQIVRDLSKDDFILEEDGRSQTIRYFGHENDLSLTLGLLVDISLSQRNVLGQEQSASTRFLDQVLREKKDKALISTALATPQTEPMPRRVITRFD